jgi:hypothetical protein
MLCAVQVTDYAAMLARWASHGYLVFASNEHDDLILLNPGK